MSVFFVFVALLSLLSTACAGIVYLCDCHATQQRTAYPFAGIIYYDSAPNGNQPPEAQNIAIVEPGPLAFQAENFQHYGIFPLTGEVFVASAMNQQAKFTEVAGTGFNGQQNFQCRKDDESSLFSDGFLSCNRGYYCQPT